MKTLSLLTAVVAFGLTMAVGDAEAKRLGSGKSSGMQRESEDLQIGRAHV